MIQEALKYVLGLTTKPIVPIDDADLAAPAMFVREETENGAKFEIVSLEEHQIAPAMIRQKVMLTSPGAFVKYVERYQDEKATVVFVGRESFTAVLDYHESEDYPRWGRHTAIYQPKFSNQWTAWHGNAFNGPNKKAHNQLDFAFFLEERADDIVDPEPDIIVTAATKFAQNQDMQMVSNQNLDNGNVRLQFTKENVQGQAEFPHKFTLRIPIYEHHEPIDLVCRFRFRVADNGVLRLWYQFVNDPTDIVRKHFETVSNGIREGLDAPFFEGSV